MSCVEAFGRELSQQQLPAWATATKTTAGVVRHCLRTAVTSRTHFGPQLSRRVWLSREVRQQHVHTSSLALAYIDVSVGKVDSEWELPATAAIAVPLLADEKCVSAIIERCSHPLSLSLSLCLCPLALFLWRFRIRFACHLRIAWFAVIIA